MWLFGLFKQGRILEKGTKRRVKKLGTAFFVLYVLVLVYLLFFSEGYGRVADAEREYRYNLVPFVEIRRFCTYRKIVGTFALFTNYSSGNNRKNAKWLFYHIIRLFYQSDDRSDPAAYKSWLL